MNSETICLNCNHSFTGNYCNNCGEKAYKDNDKSIPHLFGEAFHFLTHFEGKFFNTLKAIITRPGKLSLDYCNGIRKKYFKPLSFFLMLVILYLLFPFFEGLNMKLYYHVRHDFYGDYAMQQALKVMKSKNLTDAEISNMYDLKGEKTSKFLLFIMIPAMALISWALGFKRRKLYFDHFIFSTEVSSFFLLWGFLVFPLIIGIVRMIGYPNFISSELEVAIGGLSLFLIYLCMATRRFFKFRWWYTILYSLLFSALLLLFLENIYKFILFIVAIHLI
jgi:hypothetical protein